MFRTQAFRLSKNIAGAARQQTRGYAAAPGGASSNLPLILGGLGIAGIGGYIYLDRNPSVAKDLKSEAEQKLGGAQSEVKAAESAGGAKGAVEALIKDKWVDFTLEKVEPYNHNTAIYTFKFPDSEAIAGGQIASALVTRSTDPNELVDDKGKPVIRPYTPVSRADAKGELKLMVKRYPEGKMSKYIHELKPGSTLSFKGPIPKIAYKPNELDHIIAIAGGSGITPMYQVITHALDIPEDKTKFTLIFSNVTEDDILLRKEWDSLAKEHGDRLKVVYSLDKPPRGWKGETGFITKDVIAKYAPQESTEKRKFYVCGPPGQVAAVSGPKAGFKQGEVAGALKELNYTSDDVFKF